MRYNSEKSTCFGRCFFFLVLFRQVPDELDDMLRLPGRELAQEGLELAGLAGGFQLRVEEILGPDAEIVANAEKAGHGVSFLHIPEEYTAAVISFLKTNLDGFDS